MIREDAPEKAVTSPMHERSLVHSLLRQVHEIQSSHREGRVVAIRVTMGEFSGVDADLFSSAFGELVATSPLRGASLELEIVPLTAYCPNCDTEFLVTHFQFICPTCSHRQLMIIRGEGIQLENVVMETPS